MEGNFRQNFNTIVVAIVGSADDRMRFNPSADTRIKSGDVLIVLGSRMMRSFGKKVAATDGHGSNPQQSP